MGLIRRWAARGIALCIVAAIPSAYAKRPDAPAMSKGNRAAIEAISADTIRRHLETLSSDKMEGRDSGSRGYLMAADYAAQQFKRAGAKPAGDNGTYFQDVPTVTLSPNAASTVWALVGTREIKLTFSVASDRSSGPPLVTPEPTTAPLVFAGYGISNPDAQWDDYATLDVKDKIVVVLSGAPPGMADNNRRGAGSSFAKARAARQKGARGLVILVPEKELAQPRPGFMVKSRPIEPRRDAAAPISISVSRESASALFEGSGSTIDEATKTAEKPGSGFALKTSLKLDILPATVTDSKNPNVIASVPGTDPKLKDECVIYSAHLDHVGMGAPVNGDHIFNGALDNASGSAVILALAEAFAKLPGGPKRTMVFLLVTGEERGFWGSGHYVKNPKWLLSKTAANINIDMIMGWKPSKSIVASGSQKSTLKQVVAEAAEWMGLTVAEDPFPRENFFYRSDQIVFARAGVPALFLQPGPHWEGMTEEESKAALQNWLNSRYHKVGDEIQPDWDFRAFQRIAQVAFLMGQRINELDAMPTWNPGDEFEDDRLKSIKEGT